MLSVNPKTRVDVCTLATLFARENLSASDLEIANSIVHDIRRGEFVAAKHRAAMFSRPEFGASEYYARKQFTAFLTKVPFTGNSASRKKKAISSFWDSERRCWLANVRLSDKDYMSCQSPLVREVISRARGLVRSYLGGPLTVPKLHSILSKARPGSGVAGGTHNRYRVSLPFKLMDTSCHVTSGALPYMHLMFRIYQKWALSIATIDWEKRTYRVPFTVARSNHITFVPKDSVTLRTIAIEPSINVCLQLGVHEYLADRLDIIGNGIRSQERNQLLAQRGSTRPLCSSLATIDLSSASDSISIELVRTLLPPDWFAFLDDLRCSEGLLGNETVEYEKFSSMGNGFTFALETILFLALAKAATSVCSHPDAAKDVSVYGDDIIVPSNAALLLTEVLGVCGFVINHDKSYYTGPFRESCGADWWHGLRVTPQYVRNVNLRHTDCYALVNRLDPCFNLSGTRKYLIDECRRSGKLVFGLPSDDTSGHIFTTLEYLRGAGALRWSEPYQRFLHKTIRFVPSRERLPEGQAYLAALLGHKGHFSELRSLGLYRVIWTTPGVSRGLPRFV